MNTFELFPQLFSPAFKVLKIFLSADDWWRPNKRLTSTAKSAGMHKRPGRRGEHWEIHERSHWLNQLIGWNMRTHWGTWRSKNAHQEGKPHTFLCIVRWVSIRFNLSFSLSIFKCSKKSALQREVNERPAAGQSSALTHRGTFPGSFLTCWDVPRGKTENTVKTPSALIDRLINWISGFREAVKFLRAMRKTVSWESDEGVEIFTAVGSREGRVWYTLSVICVMSLTSLHL